MSKGCVITINRMGLPVFRLSCLVQRVFCGVSLGLRGFSPKARRTTVSSTLLHFFKSKSIHNGVSGLFFFFVVGLVAPVLHWVTHQKWPSCWTRYIKWAAIVLLQIFNLLICLCFLAFLWFSWGLVCFHLQLQSITSHGPSSVSYSNMLFADATFLGGQNIIMFCRRVVRVAFI